MRIIVCCSLSVGVLAVAAPTLSPMPSAGAAPPATSRHWSVVDSPTPGTDGYLADIDVLSATDAWAVGQYSPAPPAKGINTLVEHWDGTGWKVVHSPSPGTYTGFSAVLARSPDDVWAAGSTATGSAPDQTLIEHWDGSSWSVVSSPSPGGVADIFDLMAVGASGPLWAVGTTQPTEFDANTPLMERWDGSAWHLVHLPKGYGFLFGGAAVAADDAWAVGRQGAGNDRPLIEHWDGTSWTKASAPPVDVGSLDEVAAASSDDVWAVGYGYPDGALAEHWGGTSWSLVSTPQRKNTALAGVVVGPRGGAWAVGARFLAGDKQSTLTERWNGAWRVVSSPNGALPNSSLFAVARVPDTAFVWAVGMTYQRSDAATLVERFG